MVTEVLVEKVREMIRGGLNEGRMKSVLLGEGWSLDDIGTVLQNEIGGVVKKEVKKGGLWWLVIMVGILVSMLVAVVIWFWMGEKKKVDTNNYEKWVSENTAEPSSTTTTGLVYVRRDMEVPEPALVAAEKYTNKKDGFEMMSPLGWVRDDSGVLGGSVTFLGPEATESGVVYRANVNVVVGPANGNSLTGYEAFYINRMAKVMPEFFIIDQKIVPVMERKVYLLRASFAQEGLKLNARVLMMVENDKVYIATAMFLDREWANLNQIVDASILTLNPTQ